MQSYGSTTLFINNLLNIWPYVILWLFNYAENNSTKPELRYVPLTIKQKITLFLHQAWFSKSFLKQLCPMPNKAKAGNNYQEKHTLKQNFL